MKRSLLIQAVVVIALSSAASPPVIPGLTAYDLGPGEAFGINSAGTVVGARYTPSGAPSAFSFYAGTMKDLGSLGGGSSVALNINNAGDIVGHSPTTSGGYTHGFLYRNGAMTDVGTLGFSTYARGVNSAGTVVGESQKNQPYFPTRAFIYTAGVITDLGTLGGLYSSAQAINSAGTVVGKADTSSSTHAFRYENGKMTDLGSLNGGSSSAWDINDGGTIVGLSTSQGYNHAVRWEGGLLKDLGTLSGSAGNSEAYGINSLGVIVGASDALVGARWTRHAVVYLNGSVMDLAPYLATVGLTGLSMARDINDNGDIVGFAQDANGYNHAFLLSVPEPSAAALLLLGAAVWCRQRRQP